MAKLDTSKNLNRKVQPSYWWRWNLFILKDKQKPHSSYVFSHWHLPIHTEISKVLFTWNKSSQEEKRPSNLVTPGHLGEEKDGKLEWKYANRCKPFVSAAVWLVSVKLCSDTQEVIKCERRGEAHRLWRLKTCCWIRRKKSHNSISKYEVIPML